MEEIINESIIKKESITKRMVEIENQLKDLIINKSIIGEQIKQLTSNADVIENQIIGCRAMIIELRNLLSQD